MTYLEAELYLTSFINYEKLDSYDYNQSFKLDRMRDFARLLSDPHKGMRSIHIAGSKGKGSTAAFTYSILRQAGFKVGLYTSPHLVSLRERIRIDDALISEEDICKHLERIKKVTDSFSLDDPPTFFEVYTALAFLYFKENAVDFAVYEVGLGGRLDATNIVEPLVTAITPISYEHTQKLGNTLAQIASEKAGIVKEGVACVSAPQDPEALSVIESTCAEKKAELRVVSKDIIYQAVSSDDSGQVFNVKTPLANYSALRTSLLGAHQMMNASTAIGIIECLQRRGVRIEPDAVRRGIESTQWQGRLEVAGRSPTIALDGAHNRASARVAVESVRKIFKYKKLILVLGVSKDKDVQGIVEEFLPVADSLILTKSKIAERALEPSAIEAIVDRIQRKDALKTSTVEEAMRSAMAIATADDLILVTGSLFVVGEAKIFLDSSKPEKTAGLQNANA